MSRGCRLLPLVILGAAAALPAKSSRVPRGRKAASSPLSLNLQLTDVIIPPAAGESMNVALSGGPSKGSGRVALLDSSSQRSVAEAEVLFRGGTAHAIITIPEGGVLPEADYVIIAHAEMAGKRKGNTCSARAIHADRLKVLMELEGELLFSSSRCLRGTDNDAAPGVSRALALVQASLTNHKRSLNY